MSLNKLLGLCAFLLVCCATLSLVFAAADDDYDERVKYELMGKLKQGAALASPQDISDMKRFLADPKFRAEFEQAAHKDIAIMNKNPELRGAWGEQIGITIKSDLAEVDAVEKAIQFKGNSDKDRGIAFKWEQFKGATLESGRLVDKDGTTYRFYGAGTESAQVERRADGSVKGIDVAISKMALGTTFDCFNNCVALAKGQQNGEYAVTIPGKGTVVAQGTADQPALRITGKGVQITNSQFPPTFANIDGTAILQINNQDMHIQLTKDAVLMGPGSTKITGGTVILSKQPSPEGSNEDPKVTITAVGSNVEVLPGSETQVISEKGTLTVLSDNGRRECAGTCSAKNGIITTSDAVYTQYGFAKGAIDDPTQVPGKQILLYSVEISDAEVSIGDKSCKINCIHLEGTKLIVGQLQPTGTGPDAKTPVLEINRGDLAAGGITEIDTFGVRGGQLVIRKYGPDNALVSELFIGETGAKLKGEMPDITVRARYVLPGTYRVGDSSHIGVGLLVEYNSEGTKGYFITEDDVRGVYWKEEVNPLRVNLKPTPLRDDTKPELQTIFWSPVTSQFYKIEGTAQWVFRNGAWEPLSTKGTDSIILAYQAQDKSALDLNSLLGAGNIRKGSSGDQVLDLQTRLRLAGFDPGSPDGDAGLKTAAAIGRLQEYAIKNFKDQVGKLFPDGFKVDQVYGPKTDQILALVIGHKIEQAKGGDLLQGKIAHFDPADVPISINGVKPSPEVAQRFLDNGGITYDALMNAYREQAVADMCGANGVHSQSCLGVHLLN